MHEPFRRNDCPSNFCQIVCTILENGRSEEDWEQNPNDLTTIQSLIINIDCSKIVRYELNEVPEFIGYFEKKNGISDMVNIAATSRIRPHVLYVKA